jgi:hypothetical protein
MVELLMHLMGWDTVWYAHPGTLWNALKWGGRWHVGVWQGDVDLCLVRESTMFDDPEQLLSPGGRTILSAALKSWLKRRRVG